MTSRARQLWGLGQTPPQKMPQVGEMWWTLADDAAYPTLIQSVDRVPCTGGHQRMYQIRVDDQVTSWTAEGIEVAIMNGFLTHERPPG